MIIENYLLNRSLSYIYFMSLLNRARIAQIMNITIKQGVIPHYNEVSEKLISIRIHNKNIDFQTLIGQHFVMINTFKLL